MVMQVAAKPLAEVFETLAGALDDLDRHGAAMAALHLAMAVDCLRASIEGEAHDRAFPMKTRPNLRLVASS
ncbi:MAG: hypothetical protein ACK4UL_09475 [Novosphingobium meiothermophilum]|uniref:hypothetical protein n=2 Tax=Novosphingobium TaxID=165696 RepID=UPI0025871896|nr:hypothetical protein [Novosphingobium sp.]